MTCTSANTAKFNRTTESGNIAAFSELPPLKVPRMGTIMQAAEIFGLPVHFVRKKVLSGEVVAVKAGKRYLVNLDKFAEYLNAGEQIAPDSSAAKVLPFAPERGRA